MAIRYVKHTGSNTSPYDTWAKAATTMATVAGADTAGDTIYVADDHAESTASAVSLDWAGSAASPVNIICGNDSAEPPTAVASTATVTTTGNNAIQLAAAGDIVALGGIIYSAGSGANSVNITTGGASTVVYVIDSKLRLGGTSGGNINLAASSSYIRRCDFKFAAAASTITLGAGTVSVWRGGALESGGTSPTNLVGTGSGTVVFNGVDMSNASSTINLASNGSTGAMVTFIDCKLPASWSGSLHSGTPAAGAIFEMFNCDSGDTNYRYRRATQFGTMQEETTIIRTGGASDGTTGLSYKMVTNANAEYPMLTLDSPEIVKWNDTTGSAVTATIEFVHDSATALTDAEVWMEVMYLGTSGTPLALFIDDAKADVLATAADQTDSSETWTTTGMANPNTRKMSVTFTPQEKGFIHAVVKLAKASTTVYYCPKMDIT